MKTIQHQLNQSKKKLIKTVFGFFSLSTMLFVFQACYGTPQDFGQDVQITGKVVSASNHQPIPEIKIQIENLPQYTKTSPDGSFSIFCPKQEKYILNFHDEDAELHGSYKDLDSVIVLEPNQELIHLSISLSEN